MAALNEAAANNSACGKMTQGSLKNPGSLFLAADNVVVAAE
jgi:hypothetical protein